MHKKLPIFYSALLLTGVNLLLRFVSTSFQVLISRRIGAAGVGLLQLVLSVGALAMTAGIAGIRTATMYLTAEELGKKRPQCVSWVLSGCFLYSIVCSIGFGFLLYFSAPYLAKHWVGNPNTTASIRLYAAFLPVCCLCGVMTGYFTAANRIGTLAAVEIGEQLISMSVTLLLLWAFAGTDSAAACQCIVFGSGLGACFTLVCLVVLRIRERPKPGPRIPVQKRLMQAALPLALADDVKVGISTTENLMVPKRLALYSSERDPLAAFGAVCGMVFPILMFPAAILFALAELLIPELARCAAAGSTKRIRYLVQRGLHVTVLYGGLFCGLELLLAEDLCMALYKNPDAGHYLKSYALLIPMLYCDAITDAMTKGLGQQKICVRYNILTSAMDVALLFVLLPRYGMGGYFFSFLVTHLLNFVLSLRRLLKIVGHRLSWKGPILALTSIFCATYASSFVGGPIGRVLAYCGAYGALLCLFGVIGKEDILWIRGLVAKK